MAIGSANLNIMKKAAYAAGRSLAKDFREVENLQVSMKGAGDFVSKADIRAEEILKEELLGARPTYGWLGEETDGEIKGEDPTRRWIVDPLDGTTNFLHGMPHWAVSIALEHKGEIVAGVILDPAKDEMFFAEKGQGAWMNQSRIRVSGRRSMSEAVFGTGIQYANSSTLPATLQDLARLMPMCAGARRWGGRGAGSRLCRGWSFRGLLGARREALGCRRRCDPRAGGRRSGRGYRARRTGGREQTDCGGQRPDLREIRKNSARFLIQISLPCPTGD